MTKTKKSSQHELNLEDNQNNNLENEYFEINLDTFLFNAGVIGFIEVLEELKENHKANKGASLDEKKDFYYEGQTLYVNKIFIENKIDDITNSYIKILLEAIELPPLKMLSESTINTIIRLYRKVINVMAGKSYHQNKKGRATGKTCRPRLILPPARRAPAAPLTPRPTAFHSPASIRRFPPGTRRRYARVRRPD